MTVTVQTVPRGRRVLAGVATALIAVPAVIGALPVTSSAVRIPASVLTWRSVGLTTGVSLLACNVRLGASSVLS